MEAPVDCPIGAPPVSSWTWIQRSASSPSVGVHTPSEKNSRHPFFCTWFYILSPSFLFLNASFWHPCTSLSPSKLLSNKQSIPSYVFLSWSHFCCIHTQVFFQCCYLDNLDFVWYYSYIVAWVQVTMEDCTPTLPYQDPVHTGIILFTIYTHWDKQLYFSLDSFTWFQLSTSSFLSHVQPAYHSTYFALLFCAHAACLSLNCFNHFFPVEVLPSYEAWCSLRTPSLHLISL